MSCLHCWIFLAMHAAIDRIVPLIAFTAEVSQECVLLIQFKQCGVFTPPTFWGSSFITADFMCYDHHRKRNVRHHYGFTRRLMDVFFAQLHWFPICVPTESPIAFPKSPPQQKIPHEYLFKNLSEIWLTVILIIILLVPVNSLRPNPILSTIFTKLEKNNILPKMEKLFFFVLHNLPD